MVPVRIQAQALRRWQAVGFGNILGPFAMTADEPGPGATAAGGKNPWRQSDIKRALTAAEQAGLQSYRVEIAPDGTISIVVGAPADTAMPDCSESPAGS